MSSRGRIRIARGFPNEVPVIWVWFTNTSDTFERRAVRERTVRKLLLSAAERGLPVGVGEVNPGACVVPQDGFVEGLEDASLLRRVSNGQRMPALFARGGLVQISILAPRGLEQGEVEVLGEWDVVENGIRRRGVRVSIPKALVHVQRRIHHRVTVAFDLSPRAWITEALDRAAQDADSSGEAVQRESDPPRNGAPDGHAPDAPAFLASGRVLDISESGARLRLTSHEEAGPPGEGSVVSLAARFPACFPSFECRAQIVHRVRAVRAEGWILGLEFLEGRPDLSRAIHQLELRRAQRFGNEAMNLSRAVSAEVGRRSGR